MENDITEEWKYENQSVEKGRTERTGPSKWKKKKEWEKLK